MSDRKQVNVNEAALDWLREHDQPINDAPQPAATECPQCGGEKNNPCFLWTQTTGWGDVECGPKCANIFHNAPTPAASQPTVTLTHDQRSYIADTLQMALKWLKPYAPDSAIATVTFSRLQDALALLRAAEQK